MYIERSNSANVHAESDAWAYMGACLHLHILKDHDDDYKGSDVDVATTTMYSWMFIQFCQRKLWSSRTSSTVLILYSHDDAMYLACDNTV